jgi:lactate permease
MASMLVLTRLPQLPFGRLLNSVSIRWDGIFGTEVSASSQPLYLPGTMFVVTVALTFLMHRMPFRSCVLAIRESAVTLAGAGFVLVFTVPMVRIYINSGVNASAWPSMPVAMALWVSEIAGRAWPFFAPSVGAFGAFIAGSNTVSNLMFSLFQYSVAYTLGISGCTVVALQAVGAAAGNMVAIHNIVAASATVGFLGREGQVLRKTILPTLYYVLLTGVLGLVAVYMLDLPDPL